MNEEEKTKIMTELLNRLALKALKGWLIGRAEDEDFQLECYEEAEKIRKLSAEFGRPLPPVPVPKGISKHN